MCVRENHRTSRTSPRRRLRGMERDRPAGEEEPNHNGLVWNYMAHLAHASLAPFDLETEALRTFSSRSVSFRFVPFPPPLVAGRSADCPFSVVRCLATRISSRGSSNCSSFGSYHCRQQPLPASLFVWPIAIKGGTSRQCFS